MLLAVEANVSAINRNTPAGGELRRGGEEKQSPFFLSFEQPLIDRRRSIIASLHSQRFVFDLRADWPASKLRQQQHHNHSRFFPPPPPPPLNQQRKPPARLSVCLVTCLLADRASSGLFVSPALSSLCLNAIIQTLKTAYASRWPLLLNHLAKAAPISREQAVCCFFREEEGRN